MILAGDLGGTHTRLAIFPPEPGTAALMSAHFASADYPDFAALLDAFRARHPGLSLTHCALAVAGPVLDNRCHATNLPWHLDAREIARTLDLAPGVVALLNDVEAAALGLPAVPAERFAVLQRGDPEARGNQALIAPGTGLGEAILYWDGTGHHAFATEGGHSDFAPRDELEAALLHHAARRFPAHVSVERLISGPGIALIHEFLCTRAGGHPAWMPPPDADAGAAISARALAREDPRCVQALVLYAALLGAEAGNLALKAMAVGGVVIAGGIAPKILPILADGVLLENFLAKGRFRELLQRIPLTICLDERAPLLGALRRARGMP
ncbi:MAG: glucokinase [Gammaproteobacteria bacterium]|nr:glucokinase [Gammaproteobacteria bacterium]